jgi:hypothetical protein
MRPGLDKCLEREEGLSAAVGICSPSVASSPPYEYQFLHDYNSPTYYRVCLPQPVAAVLF